MEHDEVGVAIERLYREQAGMFVRMRTGTARSAFMRIS
jgi:hypothetical protein